MTPEDFEKEWMSLVEEISKTGNSYYNTIETAFDNLCMYKGLVTTGFSIEADKFNLADFVPALLNEGFIPVASHINPADDTTECAKILRSKNAYVSLKFDHDFLDYPNGSVAFSCNNIEDAKRWRAFVEPFIIARENLKTISLLVIEDGMIDSYPMPSFRAEPLIRENYTQNVLEGYDHIVQQLASDKPNGRLHLLEGQPGTGKSRLVSSLILDAEAKFIIVPSLEASQLVSPSFMTFLASQADGMDVPIVLVIEDAEALLQKRKNTGAGEAAIVSAILNLVDSPIAIGLNIHIIATFNAKLGELDSAATRPGRMGTHILVPSLDYTQANDVYRRLKDNKEVDLSEERSYTLAEVYGEAAENKSTFLPDNTKTYKPGVYN